MACIDSDGNITRTAEMILLAVVKPSNIEQVIEECKIAPFRVRSGLRELLKAGLIKHRDDLFQITLKGIEKLEGSQYQVV